LTLEEPVLRIMERTTDIGAVVLTLQGEIDIATVDALRARLADACQGDITIDLRRVGFLDCVGLKLLLEQHERSTAHGWRLDFVQGPPAVRRLFEMSGTLERLSFVEPVSRRFASAG
jgi:anti-anti-sigma factor